MCNKTEKRLLQEHIQTYGMWCKNIQTHTDLHGTQTHTYTKWKRNILFEDALHGKHIQTVVYRSTCRYGWYCSTKHTFKTALHHGVLLASLCPLFLAHMDSIPHPLLAASQYTRGYKCCFPPAHGPPHRHLHNNLHLFSCLDGTPSVVPAGLREGSLLCVSERGGRWWLC